MFSGLAKKGKRRETGFRKDDQSNFCSALLSKKSLDQNALRAQIELSYSSGRAPWVLSRVMDGALLSQSMN